MSKIGDLEEMTEEIYADLNDIWSVKDTLNKKKEDFLRIQKMVVENC